MCRRLDPTVVAFHVRLVHDVETEGIHHGVHLRLAWVVAGAHGVDVGFLHHREVFPHRPHVDGTAIFRMRVLRVHALEEHTLAVDIHQLAIAGYLAEAILRVPCHFLVALGILLCDDDIVEIRIFGAPSRQMAQACDACGGSIGSVTILCPGIA